MRLWHQLATAGLLITSHCLAQTAAASGGPKVDSGSSEEVAISEIMILTPKPYDPDQVAEARRTADELRAAILRGASFSDVAKAQSQGPTASYGGFLGRFKRGELAPSLEELVFRMKAGEISEVVRTKQGFIILKVMGRTDASLSSPFALLTEPTTPELKSYSEKLIARIQQRWYQLIPASALAPKMKQGSLALQFTIRRDGALTEAAILSSSGDTDLDEAAMAAVRQASPFPRLDNVTPKDHVTIRAKFFYNPEKTTVGPN
ncbi:MAG TPA: TonB family protein [Candidatus Angelobacter sp.]